MISLAIIYMILLSFREHNRIVDLLKAKSPKMSGEDLFQHARRLVIAEMQNIVFSEFLPITLGTLLHDLHLYYESIV